MRHCVRDEGFTKYGAISVFMLSWEILVSISSYLSVSNSLCMIQRDFGRWNT